MRPCRFYAINRKKDGFKCEYEEHESLLYFRLAAMNWDFELNSFCNRLCPKFADCVKLADETFRKFDKRNSVVNVFSDGRVEIVKYNKDFNVPLTVINDKSDRRRSFKLVNMDFLVPVKKEANQTRLRRSVMRAGKHAFDSFKGYALSNKWSYFFTFTFSPVIVPFRNNLFLVRDLWRKFQRLLKRLDSNSQILNAPEPHKDGALHFHCLLNLSQDLPIVDYGDISKLPQRTCNGGPDKGKTGFCTFTPEGTFTYLPKTKYKMFLVPYYNYGELQRSKLGDVLFCLNVYPYGINSCAILPGDETNQEKVGNYCSVYMMKDGNSQYNQRRFMRTRNVKGKTKETFLLSDEELQRFIELYSLQEYKTDDKLTVYRNFNLDKTLAVTPLAERMKR